ncbi:hypothetical protein [Nocardia niigatensis]|uniref:hypothetical protein n=1 Tax=Nocardia niigatensis TaxID=209249 RepID=UPI0002FD22CB|nr:hypothetical protein [Nocardia niigatensis]
MSEDAFFADLPALDIGDDRTNAPPVQSPPYRVQWRIRTRELIERRTQRLSGALCETRSDTADVAQRSVQFMTGQNQ